MTPTRATGHSCAATASSSRCRSPSRPSAPPTARSPATSASGATSPPSARRRSELRDAEERFRNAFDQAPIGKALVSPDGRFTRVNSALCSILGYGEAELLETTFQTLTHPDDLDVDLGQHAPHAGGQERVVRDGEALPARRRPLHLGPPERLPRARRGRRAALLRLADPGHQRAEADQRAADGPHAARPADRARQPRAVLRPARARCRALAPLQGARCGAVHRLRPLQARQ